MIDSTAIAFSAQYLLRRRAYAALHRAERSGQVVRPGCCQDCGKRRKVAGHHDDYSKALAVRWLCSRCHALRTREIRVLSAELIDRRTCPA
jgi:hypothetical protein